MAQNADGDASIITTKNPNVLFKPIDGEESVHEATEVESYCVSCEKNGITKLLLTSVPFYKDIILASFFCPHCNFSNNEIQSASEISRTGIEYSLDVTLAIDLNRQIIKSDYASVDIPEIELEIPQGSQKGEITTVEGILQRAIEGLSQDQARRAVENPEDFVRIQDYIGRIEKLKGLEQGFKVKIRDISGASFIGPPPGHSPGEPDPRLKVSTFNRTVEEDKIVGIYPELSTIDEAGNIPVPKTEGDDEEGNLNDEVHVFETTCPNCKSSCETKMKMTEIPHFKEAVIMATNCEVCGVRSNEVKSGSGIEPKGRKITLEVLGTEDLSRDLLKSETCSIDIPSLDLHVGAMTLGGKFTTVEGLLVDIKEQLGQENPFISGDSVDDATKGKMVDFHTKLDKCIKVEVPFTMILDDPAGNSYLQSLLAPEPDPQITILDYDRTPEQNEELGLNDMKTEGYESEKPAGPDIAELKINN